jgi:quercetin dioxygenase-like cupin family protein
MRTNPAGPAIVTVLILILALAAWSPATARQDGTGGATPAPVPSVEREVLSESVDAAPGEVLALARYTIPPGAVLTVHTHPGVQMAVVESGTLTYHVVEAGAITVTRADGTVEEVGPGASTDLGPGDAWVEPEGMVHYAENLTDQPVVLLSASLFTAGEPASTDVDAATPVT